MIKEGIREHSAFSELHPAVTTIWYVITVGITMFANEPLLLIICLFLAAVYRILLNGVKDLKPTIYITLFMIVFVSLTNGIFTHNGATVLFYIGSNRITAEAFAFGAVMSVMFSTVLLWLVSFSVITTSDKMIYIFGAVLPVIGLVISIIFRSIPLLRKRFSDIDSAQKAMGRGEIKGPVRRVGQYSKELSILIAWSLEASIDTADSMTARGYGIGRRTNFHLFRFRARDFCMLAVILVLGGAAVWARYYGFGRVYYYPTIRSASQIADPLILFICYIVYFSLNALPIVFDLYGEYVWRK